MSRDSLDLDEGTVVRVEVTWYGSPGMSGWATYELRLLGDGVEWWGAVDEDPLELISRGATPGWRAGLALVCQEEEMWLASRPEFQGGNPVLHELIELGLRSPRDKRIAMGLAELTDPQLASVYEACEALCHGPSYRAFDQLQEQLDELDGSIGQVAEQVVGSAPSFEDAPAWIEELWAKWEEEQRLKKLDEERRREARAESLEPYSEQIERILAVLPGSAEYRGGGGMHGAFRAWKRWCVVTAVEESFLATGSPPTGKRRFEHPQWSTHFSYDFDVLMKAARSGTEAPQP